MYTKFHIRILNMDMIECSYTQIKTKILIKERLLLFPKFILEVPFPKCNIFYKF